MQLTRSILGFVLCNGEGMKTQCIAATALTTFLPGLTLAQPGPPIAGPAIREPGLLLNEAEIDQLVDLITDGTNNIAAYKYNRLKGVSGFNQYLADQGGLTTALFDETYHVLDYRNVMCTYTNNININNYPYAQCIPSDPSSPCSIPLYTGKEVGGYRIMFRYFDEVISHNALLYAIERKMPAVDTATAQNAGERAKAYLLALADNVFVDFNVTFGPVDIFDGDAGDNDINFVYDSEYENFFDLHTLTDGEADPNVNCTPAIFHQIGGCYDRTNAAIESALAFMHFAQAYDLISSMESFTGDERIRVEEFLARGYNVIHQGTQYWYNAYHGTYSKAGGNDESCALDVNHPAHHLAALGLIGFVLDRADMVCEVLPDGSCGDGLSDTGPDETNARNWYDLLEKIMYMDGQPAENCDIDAGAPYDGEIVDRFRHVDPTPSGYGYSLLSLESLSILAEAARHNSLDIFPFTTPSEENLRLAAEFYSYYQGKFFDINGTPITNGPGDPTPYDVIDWYNGEMPRIGHFAIFELLSLRYPGNEGITKAFDSVNMLTPDEQHNARRFNSVLLYGKDYIQNFVAWQFNSDDIFDGWDIYNNSDVQNLDVFNGSLSFDTADDQIGNFDPGIVVRNLSANPNNFYEIEIRIKIEDVTFPVIPYDPSLMPLTTRLDLFWYNNDIVDGPDGRECVQVDMNIGWQTITIEIDEDKCADGWNPCGLDQIHTLRIDPVSPVDGQKLRVDIDYIILR